MHYREELPLILETDASDRGVGAVLLHQLPDKSERPVAFASRTFLDREKNYSVIDKEALAIIFGVTKFYQYVYGRKFTLRTDHKPLEHILAPPPPADLQPMLGRPGFFCGPISPARFLHRASLAHTHPPPPPSPLQSRSAINLPPRQTSWLRP